VRSKGALTGAPGVVEDERRGVDEIADIVGAGGEVFDAPGQPLTGIA
jgi:hypothetical protein